MLLAWWRRQAESLGIPASSYLPTILAWSGGLPLDLTPIRGKGCFCFDLVDSDLGGY